KLLLRLHYALPVEEDRSMRRWIQTHKMRSDIHCRESDRSRFVLYLCWRTDRLAIETYGSRDFPQCNSGDRSCYEMNFAQLLRCLLRRMIRLERSIAPLNPR